MKLLAVTSRFPERSKRGDQSRAFGFLTFLSTRHEVTVVSAGAPSSESALKALAASCTVVVPRSGLIARAASAVGALLRGQPAQAGWMMPSSAWRDARRRSDAFDVVLINTVRSLRGPLSRPMVVDYIDALSWNMRVRARGPEALPIRWVASLEARRLEDWERDVARWASGGIATTQEVAETLPIESKAAIIPVALQSDVVDTVDGPRDIDLILTGDMRYPPNREAAGLLAREIMPSIRRRLPSTSCWIVGRHARDLGLEGVELRSDVSDVGVFLRRAKLAVAPVRGRGSLYKVLEAAANGAAVVAPTWALEAYGLKGTPATDAGSFAEAAVRLLTHPGERQLCAADALEVARLHSLTILGPRYDAVLTAAHEGRDEVGPAKFQ